MPVFIIAAAMLLSLIKLTAAVEDCYAETAEKCLTQIEAQAVSAGTKELIGIKVNAGKGIEIDNVIVIPASFENKLSFSGAYRDREWGEIFIAYRPFVGESSFWENIDSTVVYVFPENGERYHVEGCRYLKDGAVECTLNSALREKYKSCKICNAGDLPDGSMVYLFSSQSNRYHKKDCSVISKCYEAMTKTEAEEKGYTPCRVCLKGCE